jgi:hypothetical protein
VEAGEYKNTGVYPVELADGRIVPVGEFRKLNEKQLEDEGNQLHIDEGRLTRASEPEAEAASEEGSKESTSKAEGTKKGGN